MGKRRDRHEELVGLLEEVMEELRRRPVGPPWEVTIQPASPSPWLPQWQAERPRVAPMVVPMVMLYGVDVPLGSGTLNYTTGTTVRVH